jgi:hypothetical protein
MIAPFLRLWSVLKASRAGHASAGNQDTLRPAHTKRTGASTLVLFAVVWTDLARGNNGRRVSKGRPKASNIRNSGNRGVQQ